MLSMFALASLIDSLPTVATETATKWAATGEGEHEGFRPYVVEIAGRLAVSATPVTVESWRGGKRVARRQEWEIAVVGVAGVRRVRGDMLAARAVGLVLPSTYRKVAAEISVLASRIEQVEV